MIKVIDRNIESRFESTKEGYKQAQTEARIAELESFESTKEGYKHYDDDETLATKSVSNQPKRDINSALSRQGWIAQARVSNQPKRDINLFFQQQKLELLF